MDQKLPLKRLYAVGKPFWVSRHKWRGLLLLGGILGLLFAIIFVNVGNSYLTGRMMDALQARESATFYKLAGTCVLVMLAGLPVGVYYGWLRTRLAILWRQWLTAHLVGKYLSSRAYYRIASEGKIDNPDERITQDVDTFCNMSVGLSMSLVDSILNICSFAGVLFSISFNLTLFDLAYAAVGSVATVWLGNRLIALNFEHTKLEADLRYSITDVRRDFESIAFYRSERRVKLQILRNLLNTMRNIGAINDLNRNLSFFISGFNQMVPSLAVVLAAPLFFRNEIKFGDLTQATMAFGAIFGGMTLLVNQWNPISAFAANINRLGSFLETLDAMRVPGTPTDVQAIETIRSDHLELQKVTVKTPDGRVLVRELSLSVGDGGLMIIGPSGAGKSSVLRAIAGIWTAGSGTLLCPPLQSMMFLPQRVHLPPCTLREALAYPRTRTSASDMQLCAILKLVNLSELPARCGGLDASHEWRDMLSQGEQQRLSFARLLLHRPKWAVLDEVSSALDEENEKALHTLLAGYGITPISVGHRQSLRQYHSQVLLLKGDGSWELQTASA